MILEDLVKIDMTEKTGVIGGMDLREEAEHSRKREIIY